MTAPHEQPLPKSGIITSLESLKEVDFKTIIGSVTAYDNPKSESGTTPFSAGLSLHYWHLKPPENGEPLDNQKPHLQDELYMILEGEGVIDIEGKLTDVIPGDIIFVQAQVPHHFHQLKSDSMKILIFFGPNWCGRDASKALHSEDK